MIHDKLCYGVPESVDNRYLYIRKIVISNYHNPENVDVYYDNIYNLLDKIDSDIKFENSLKKESE